MGQDYLHPIKKKITLSEGEDVIISCILAPIMTWGTL